MRNTSTLDPNSSPLAFCAGLDIISAPTLTSLERDRLDALEAKARMEGLSGSDRSEYMLLLRSK